MSQGIPQEGAPITPPETEVSVVEQDIVRGTASLEGAEATGPVLYLPKEMPTDPEEYKRVLESIYAQAGKIVEDRAHVQVAKAEHEEFAMMEEVAKENKETLAAMNASQLGFFSRLGNWIRGQK